MKNRDFKTIKNNINKKVALEENLNLALEYAEENYLTYFMQELKLNYVSFLDDEILSCGDDFVIEVSSYFEELLKETKVLFDKENFDYGDALDRCLDFKERAKDRMKVLLSYNDEITIYETILNRKHYCFYDAEEALEDDEGFTGRVVQYIFSDENNVLINDRIKRIYGQLPIKITKNRFYNLSDLSIDQIKGASKEAVLNYIEFLKDNFNPCDANGFTVYFKGFYETLNQLANADYDSLNADGYEELIALKDKLAGDIDQLVSKYIYVITIINKLLGVLNILQKSPVTTFSKHIFLFNEFFEAVFKAKESKEIFNEEILSYLSDMEGIVEESLVRIGNSNQLIEIINYSYTSDIEGFSLGDRFKNIQGVQSFASSSLYDESDERNIGDELMDARTLSEVKNDLNNYYSQFLDQWNRNYIRAKYSFMFSLFNVTQKKPQEIYDFILEMLSNCKNIEEKRACQELINSTIEID